MKRYRDIADDGGSNILGQVQERERRVRERLAAIERPIAVLSGKGGVGKSVISANLAAALASRGFSVGVLDADVNGPSMAKMLGVRNQSLEFTPEAVLPAVGPLGIRVLSMDLLLPSDDTPVNWHGPKHESFVWRATIEVSSLYQFLADVQWGRLDYLIVDLPPGTDRISQVAALLARPAGCVLVTVPAEVSRLTVRKSIAALRACYEAPVRLGLVENMSGYFCSSCQQTRPLFPGGDTEKMAREQGLEFLGAIAFDWRMAAAADEGKPFVLEHPDAPAAHSLRAIAQHIHATWSRPEGAVL